MAEKQSTSPWVWLFLVLMLVSFVAFILFLDQKIVKSGTDSQNQQPDSGSENKPVIDFFEILPNREVEINIPEEDQAGIENPSINKEAEQNFVLQVGSFQSASDAESRKAELAFLGLQARVNSAQVNDETWYRVVLGPFDSNSRLSQAKNLLIENDIAYMRRSLQE